MKFRMVDRITDFIAQKRICGIKTVSFEEYQLKFAFGEEPKLPESLLMESLFQLGNWLIMRSSAFTRMALILRFESAEFPGSVPPGSQMEMEVQVRSYREEGILFDGQATVEGAVVVRGCGCLAIPVPLEDYASPEDMEVLFAEIYKPASAAEGGL